MKKASRSLVRSLKEYMAHLVVSREKMVVRLESAKGPEGSIFLQLDREMVEWMMMGGMASLVETLVQGTASTSGRQGRGQEGSWQGLQSPLE